MPIAKPSVQSLFIQMSFNGQPLATGTGFVVESKGGPVLMTNRHNVTGRHQQTGLPLSKTGGIPNEVQILHNVKGKLGWWASKTERLLAANGSSLWKEHPKLGSRADFVALPLTDTADVELYPYDLANTGPDLAVGPAEVCSVVGFPFGMQAGGSLAVWATGFIASELDIDLDNLPIFLIDCRSRQGQSGSAVIAHRNGGSFGMKDGSTAIFTGPVTKFLGIYSGRVSEESDLGIVWKASAITELVSTL